MTPKQYKRTIKSAGMSVRAAALELGLSVRHAYRFSTGEAAIPRTVEYALYWLAHTRAKVKP